MVQTDTSLSLCLPQRLVNAGVIWAVVRKTEELRMDEKESK